MLPRLASEDLTRILDQVVTTHRSQPNTIHLHIADEADSQFSLYLTNLANIAPVLSASLKQWLPEVAGGRYSDAIVNPTTLQVQVCGPTRR